ncbi:MAG TPA: ATP-binding protein [Mycobacteriales bacterium]|nr:ATP-binding protein [Mycobacteriales bacterium]
MRKGNAVLLRFRLANHRSLRADSELSLVATDHDAESVRMTGVRAEGREIAVVPTVGVFGANASGKSNLLNAMWAMREAVGKSVAEWALTPGVPREPFALDPACREQTTLFEADILLGHPAVRHTYGFELSDERVEAEWLHAYPHGRRQVWFDREADRSGGGEDFRFPGEGLRGGRKEDLVRVTRSNALFLSAAASFNHPQLRPVYRWFVDDLWLVTSGGGVASHTAQTRHLLVDGGHGKAFRERVASLLRAADLGIVDLDFVFSEPDDLDIRLLHRGTAGDPVPLDFAQESLGTHAWFALLGPMLRALDTGGVLLADELDSSLHPTLAAEVVRMFADPVANPHGAQLVFTAHDATLLGNGPVSRPLDPRPGLDHRQAKDRRDRAVPAHRRPSQKGREPGKGLSARPVRWGPEGRCRRSGQTGGAVTGRGAVSIRRRSDPRAERPIHRTRSGPRRGNRIFYVAVEGESTEPDYLAYLNQEFGDEKGFLIQVRSERNGLKPRDVAAQT